MDIDHLREYVLLSQTMSFTKAAEELHISQSALSSHVVKMEKDLNATLIDRTQLKRIRFTVAGYEFLESAAKIVSIYDEFISKPYSSSNHFIIQTLQHADRATYVLLQRVKEFKELNPEVYIEIKESIAFDTLDSIKSNTADCGYLGIRLHEPQPVEGIIAIPMLDEELIVWLDKASPLFSAEKLAPKDLECCDVPTWVGIGPNGLEDLYREIYEDYSLEVKYSPRYCISREDYFLNKIYANDAVILTEGSEHIHSIRVREDRGLRGFNPVIYVKTYVVLRESELDGALVRFQDFLTLKYAEDPQARKL